MAPHSDQREEKHNRIEEPGEEEFGGDVSGIAVDPAIQVMMHDAEVSVERNTRVSPQFRAHTTEESVGKGITQRHVVSPDPEECLGLQQRMEHYTVYEVAQRQAQYEYKRRIVVEFPFQYGEYGQEVSGTAENGRCYGDRSDDGQLGVRYARRGRYGGVVRHCCYWMSLANTSAQRYGVVESITMILKLKQNTVKMVTYMYM